MVDSTYSERGYNWTGKIVEKSMSTLVSLQYNKLGMVNQDIKTSNGMCHVALSVPP
jgi:proteasome activator subunit 4